MSEWQTEGQEAEADEEQGESGGNEDSGSQGWEETSDEPHQGEQGQDAV